MIKFESNFGTYRKLLSRRKLLSKKKSYNTLEKFSIGIISVFCVDSR